VAGRGREPSHRERWVAAKFCTPALNLADHQLEPVGFLSQARSRGPTIHERSDLFFSQNRATAWQRDWMVFSLGFVD